MPSRSLIGRRGVLANFLFAALTAVVCACLLAAAALVPAPPAVLPFVAMICVGCPMIAAWHLPGAVATIGRMDGDRALAEMRRRLDELPETRHPLGL